jgi:hypothetical protein
MVEYLSGNRIQGSSTKVTTPPQTSWKELGRTTLSSTSSDITVSSFTAKDNLMVLIYAQDGSQMGYRVNSDTGNNYNVRRSMNGASDSTLQSTKAQVHAAGAQKEFNVSSWINIANQEKFFISNTVSQGSNAGVSNNCSRNEIVGKWANTSDQITTFTLHNAGATGFSSGSEVVVLGYDTDEADSGSNFWQELGTTTATGSEDKLSVTVDKKYLMFEMYKIQNGACSADLQFNGVTGNEYTWRIQSEGGSEVASSGGQPRIVVDRGQVNNAPAFVHGFIYNQSNKEKLVMSEAVSQSTAGSYAPWRRELVGKWANTSSAITSVDMINPESGSFAAGSYLKVWGAD